MSIELDFIKQLTTTKGVKVTCKEYETKPVIVSITYNKIVGYEKIKKPTYKKVYEYRYKKSKNNCNCTV